MLIVKCNRCKNKIFKYIKIGKGQLLHCWKDRIVEDYSTRLGNKVKCRCGNVIGIEENKWIKIRKNSITTSGTKIC